MLKDKDVIEAGRSRIQELEEILKQQRKAAEKKIKDRDIQIQNINNLLKKSADTIYIKNVVIKYLQSGDNKVRY